MRAYLVLLIILSGCTHKPYGKDQFGPAHMRSQSALHFLRFAPMPESAEVLESGSFLTHYARTLANYHIANDEIIMDMESKETYLNAVFGLPYASELSFAAESREITVIGMDRFTINFHNLFNIRQDHRLDVEPDRTYVKVPALGIELTDKNIKNPISQRFNLQLRKQIFELKENGTALTVGVTGSAELENHSEAKSKRSIDQAYQLYLSVPFYQQALHFNANYIIPGNQPSTSVRLLPAWTFLLGYEVSYASVLATMLQFTYNEPIVDGFKHLSDPSLEVVLSEKLRLGQLTFEFGVLENIAWYANTADWALFYGVEAKI